VVRPSEPHTTLWRELSLSLSLSSSWHCLTLHLPLPPILFPLSPQLCLCRVCQQVSSVQRAHPQWHSVQGQGDPRHPEAHQCALLCAEGPWRRARGRRGRPWRRRRQRQRGPWRRRGRLWRALWRRLWQGRARRHGLHGRHAHVHAPSVHDGCLWHAARQGQGQRSPQGGPQRQGGQQQLVC
jgi:hypothetical protein